MKKKLKTNKNINKYGWGSTIGGILGGAAGTLIAPGVGTGLGTALGSGLGSMFDEQPSDNTNQMKPMKALTKNNIDLSLLGTNTQMFDLGGMLYEPNAEIEGGEVAITPNGKGMSTDGQHLPKISSRSFKSNGSKHSNGGHEVSLPEGTMIASDQIINPMTGKTFAKDIEKQERSKGVMEKRLKNRPEDRFIKEGIKIAGSKAEKLFKMQEALKENLMLKETMNYMAKGGMIKYDGGGKINPYDPFNQSDLYNQFETQNQSMLTNNLAPVVNPTINAKNIYAQGTLDPNNPSARVGLGVRPDVPTGDTNLSPFVSNPDYKPFDPFSNVPQTQSPETQPGSEGFDYGKYSTLLPAMIGTGMQFGESFSKDPVTRIRNPYASNAITTTNNAITNQNNLDYDVNDQLAGISSGEAATNKFIDANVAGGGSRVASRMSNRAQSFRNKNQVFGERNRMRTAIKQRGNEMLLNKANLLQGLGTEDAQYENMYREGILQRDANLRKNRYSALSNMSNVGQQFNRDQELMDLLPLLFPNAKLTR